MFDKMLSWHEACFLPPNRVLADLQTCRCNHQGPSLTRSPAHPVITETYMMKLSSIFFPKLLPTLAHYGGRSAQRSPHLYLRGKNRHLSDQEPEGLATLRPFWIADLIKNINSYKPLSNAGVHDNDHRQLSMTGHLQQCPDL